MKNSADLGGVIRRGGLEKKEIRGSEARKERRYLRYRAAQNNNNFYLLQQLEDLS